MHSQKKIEKLKRKDEKNSKKYEILKEKFVLVCALWFCAISSSKT